MKKEKLLRRLSSMQFAMWEMRIFLDTHPNDRKAQAMFNEYKEKFEILSEEFEKEFGPLTLTGTNSDEWLKDPWPWDNEFSQ